MRLRIYQCWQGVNIRTLKLRELAVFKHLAGDLVLVPQTLQHIRRSRDRFALAVLDRRGQIQFFKQDFAELLGRIDVEWLAGQLVDFRRKPPDSGVELFGENLELHRLDADAGLFNARQHDGERQVDGFVDFAQALRVDLGYQALRQG